MENKKENKFLKLLKQDSMAYINKYISQILLLMINANVYIVYSVGEAIYNVIYGSIYAISESAKRDTKREKTKEKQEEHLSNTVLINILYSLSLCFIVICFKEQIANIFLDNKELINVLNIYFVFMVMKAITISILRPLYSVGNTEGHIIEIAKINKNRLTYISILLFILLGITKILNIDNITILISIMLIYILTEIYQTYLTYKIVKKLNIKYMKFKKSIKIFKENYHYLLSMLVYDFGSIISTYIGSLFGGVGILISKILYESYKFGSFIHNIYTKYLEEQMYTGKIDKYKPVIKKLTISAIIGSVLSVIIFSLQLKFNVELKDFTQLSIYSYIFIFIYCMSYCLDYSADIVTRISGHVKQLFIISIIDLIIKLIIVAILQYIKMDMFLAFTLLLLGGFVSYINVIKIVIKQKTIKICD